MNQYPDFDQKLYDDLRRGKEYAFAAVFDRYHRLLYTIAYRFLKSEEEAEDAVQYLFMKLWDYILNELRHRNLVFEKLYEMAQQVNDEDEDAFLTRFEHGELRKSLRVAIDKLPPQKQKICLLKIEYGLSNQEIADRMGITVPTVKSHYTQAIKALRNAIESLIMWFPVIWIYLID